MASAPTGLPPSIHLAPNDWRWATWRKIPPVPLPPPAPFDHDACVARLASKVSARWDFSKAAIPPVMTRPEATFWTEAITARRHQTTPKDLAAKLATGKPSLPSLHKALAALASRDLDLATARVLRDAYSPFDLVKAFAGYAPETMGRDGGGNLLNGIRAEVVPYLDEAERDKLRKVIASGVKTTAKSFPTDYYYQLKGHVLVATMLGGFHDELASIAAGWPDDHYSRHTSWAHDAYHLPQVILFGLDDPKLVEREMRRLRLPLREPHFVRAWLAHTELSALDWAATTVIETKNKDLAASLASVLALVRDPANAGPMLEISTRSKAAAVGTQWLADNAALTTKGLAKVATGKGALAQAATQRLGDLEKKGGKAAKATTKPALPPLKEPPWLKKALAAKAKAKADTPSKLPRWLSIEVLPALDIDGKTLAAPHVEALLGALQTSPLDDPDPLVRAIREHATEASRDAFVWRLFEDWRGSGAAAKDKWALGAIGLLGGDASALALAPLVRAWPGEAQHQRAVFGLDVLGAIGSDTALMLLSGIAQRVKFQALKQRANEAMEAIAATRKMSRDELEDRIVPDGGLGEDGRRVLSYGKRSFEVVLGAEGAPMVRDEGGVRRAELPKPGKSDDAAKAAAAGAAWKQLKKTLRETTKTQIERLEQAMVKGRTWTAADFERWILQHPLQKHLARLLLWATVSGGKQTATFRIAEDGSLANVKDAIYKLPKAARVRIAHPLDLDDAERKAWGTVFGDYEILAPFPQLGRPVHALEAKEKRGDDLGPRFKGQTWGAAAFIGKMKRRGWTHGVPQDAGYVGEHYKPFFSLDLTALIEHTGYPIGGLDYADPQEIVSISFLAGLDPPGWDSRKRKRLKLSAVDAKAVSEVLYDLS